MNLMHQCKYCGREFEAKRSNARCCPDRKCQLARMRDYWHGHKPIAKPIAKPVYLLECRVCGKKVKSTNKLSRYCADHCRTVATGHYKPKATTGIAETDVKRIARRRREVYARMQQFAHLDGYRK